MNNEQCVAFVLALADAAATLEQVGGKGASLARLVAAGLPVPPGFHVTTRAYRRFVAENRLQEKILAAVSAVAADQPATLDTASREIEKLFTESVMPADIAGTIRCAYAELGGGDLPVAVRSSATAEDLPEMSFAGQQETYLNMHGEAMVLDAVKRCWASLWTARAIGYRARHNIVPQDVSLAVVVQELVPADAAGIMFTANPLTGARDQVMINAAWGLGEAIVGGQVTPDSVVVDKASETVIDHQINTKEIMTVRTAEGTREEPVPTERRMKAALNPAQAVELARLGVQIQTLYGQPMDIEWALHDSHFFIVQARPITALPASPQPAPDTIWKVPNPKGSYMRASVLELLPDPLSPLFATLGLPMWSSTLAGLMRDLGAGDIFHENMFTIINGYGYFDMTLTPAQTLRFVVIFPGLIVAFRRLIVTARRRWQEAHSRYAQVVKRWQSTDLSTTSAEALLGGVREITTEAAQYYLSVQSGILPAAYLSEALFTPVYNLLKRHEDSAALTFVLGFDSAPIQAEKSLYDLAQWTRERPELATTLQNMTGQRFTEAYHEQSGNGEWAEFWRRLTDHLARFGHTIYDLDFAKVVLADEPAPALETLKFFMSGKATNPYERQATAEAARVQATQAMLYRLHGLRLRILRFLVRAAQTFAPLREDALADVGLGWPVLRRMLREIGRRLVAAGAATIPDDVFWLTLDDVQEVAATLDKEQTLSDFHTIIAERQATWERERALTPPAALPLKRGARFLGIDFSRMMPARMDQPAGNVLKGVAASPGRVTGPARVIHGPDEFARMRQGEILVARITTPAWTSLFALAAGVVTDVGGPLSHSSIVAREYHIPAVLGTGLATERLSSGQTIIVDGNAGTVTTSGENSGPG